MSNFLLYDFWTPPLPINFVHGPEFSVRQRNANLGFVPYPLCPVPGYDEGKVQKLESLKLYDYRTLFQCR